jgi:hypothetical protein
MRLSIKTLSATTILVALACNGNAFAQSLRKSIAVTPVQINATARDTAPDTLATQLAEALQGALRAGGQFVVLQSKAAETGPPKSKAADDPFAALEAEAQANTETESNEQLVVAPGAQFVLRAGVRQYQRKGNAVVLQLNVRVLNVRSNALVSETQFSENGAPEEVVTATADAIARFTYEQTQDTPWEGHVFQTEENDAGVVLRVYVRAGSEHGLRVGDGFNVYRPGKAVTDPDTGEVLAQPKDRRLGACRVQKLTATSATCQPTLGDGFKRDDIVRVLK